MPALVFGPARRARLLKLLLRYIPLPIFRRKYRLGAMPNDLVGFPAKQRFRACTPRRYGVARIHANDGVVCRAADDGL